jgi:hypothetical protein
MASTDSQGIARIARLIARRTHNHGTVSITDARNALASADRPHFVKATMHAIGHGWINRQPASDQLSAGTPVPDETRLGLVAELDEAQRLMDLTP